MHQSIEPQPITRRPGYLAALAVMGLAVGLTVVPLDAAPRRLVYRFAEIDHVRGVNPGRHRKVASPESMLPAGDYGSRARRFAAPRNDPHNSNFKIAEPVPIPQPRPAMLGARSSTPPAAAPVNRDQTQPSQNDDAARDSEACLARLHAAGTGFDVPTMPVAVRAACAIEVPVRLKSVATRARAATDIRLSEEPIVSCQFAEQLTGWLGHLVAPLITGRMSADVRAVHTGPGYECRNRNGAANGKLSAHAVGKAIDISAFELSNGKSIPIKPNGDEAARGIVDSVRTAACGWFTTVLGPGSDAAHTDHLHVDTALHGASDRYRICQ
jgi:hypothetical protein